jgi:hypothetical protein
MYLHAIAPLFAIEAQATSLPTYNGDLGVRQAASKATNDNSSAARASFAAVSLLCMMLMASLFGTQFLTTFKF